MALTKAHNRMIEGSSVNVLDYGASPSASASANSTAIQAALDSGAARVFIPAGDYSIDTTLTVPGSTIFEGEGRFKSLLTITTDNVAVLVNGQQVLLSRFGVRTDLVGHTSNGIVIGSVSADCGRSMHEDLSIIGMGGSGLVCIHGNLQTFRNIYSINNGTHGMEFPITAGVIDNIAHKIEGVCDLRGNGTDGLHIAAGTSVSDTAASKCHSANLIVAQSNGRYGVYSGTRNNNIILYGENNTTNDLYLDTFAHGNTVTLVNGTSISDNGVGNTIVARKGGNFENLTYTRQRFSGETTGGFEIVNDDGNAGELNFRKNGTRNFEITASGSSSAFTLKFLHDQANQINSSFEGHITPNTTQTYNLGSAGSEWDNIYLVNSPIVSSDQNYKKDIRVIQDAEKAVALAIKGNLKAFRHIHAEGDDARVHIGVIAQEVEAAFLAQGLNAYDYGMICKDTWYEDADGNVFDENADGLIERSKLAIRYEQLLAFIISAL